MKFTYYLNASPDDFEDINPNPKGPEKRLVSPHKAALLLLESSSLFNLNMYSKTGETYLFDDSQGVYIELSKKELLVVLSDILVLAELDGLRDSAYLNKIYTNLPAA